MEAYRPELNRLAAEWRLAGVRQLAIGVPAAVCRARLGDLLVLIQRVLPDVAIGVCEMTRGAALAALDAGELAAAVLPGEPDARFGALQLWHDRIALLLPAGTASATVTIDAIAALSLIVPTEAEEAAFHDFAVRRLFDDAGRPRPRCHARPDACGEASLVPGHARLVPGGSRGLTIHGARAAFDVHLQWPAVLAEPVTEPAVIAAPVCRLGLKRGA